MSVCTFFGHSSCYDLEPARLKAAIAAWIAEGVTEFLVGNQGQFDRMVQASLMALRQVYPHIRYYVVLAYMPTQKTVPEGFQDHCIYPEGQELAPNKFAISRRNLWMLSRATHCICYIDYTWGGAYQFAAKASRRGLKMMNLGKANLDAVP